MRYGALGASNMLVSVSDAMINRQIKLRAHDCWLEL